MSKAPFKNRSDPIKLSATSSALIMALKAEMSGLGIKFKNQPRSEEVDTDGWGTVIARMGTGLPELQVWLDRFNGGAERRFWYGFSASKPTIIAKVTESYPSHISGREIISADLVQKKGAYSLRNPIEELQAHNPISESYYLDKEFYFGIYSFAQHEKELIEEATKFFAPAIRGILTVNSNSVDLSEVGTGDRELINRLVRDRQAKFRVPSSKRTTVSAP
jgi:hypothetical protein